MLNKCLSEVIHVTTKRRVLTTCSILETRNAFNTSLSMPVD